MPQEIPILNSDAKGLRVLLLDPDAERGQKHEAMAEQDPEFQRVDLFVVHTLHEARDSVRKYNCSLAIFPDGVDGSDFVNTQMELKNAQPNIEMIALVDVPSVLQLRSSRRIGGVIDFGAQAEITSFSAISNLIQNYLRERVKNSNGLKDLFEYSQTIKKCLLVDRLPWVKIKEQSSVLTNSMLLNYDMNDEEVSTVLAAEQIYFPELSNTQYEEILRGDRFGLVGVLKATGRWGKIGEKPTSVVGFIVTCANFIAEMMSRGASGSEIFEELQRRPTHLLHPALRILTLNKVTALCAVAPGEMKHG